MPLPAFSKRGPLGRIAHEGPFDQELVARGVVGAQPRKRPVQKPTLCLILLSFLSRFFSFNFPSSFLFSRFFSFSASVYPLS